MIASILKRKLPHFLYLLGITKVYFLSQNVNLKEHTLQLESRSKPLDEPDDMTIYCFFEITMSQAKHENSNLI
jgi:hypothetical protein